jgi:hypothetical protein
VGVYGGPDLSESGLVLALDGANSKSFKGSAAINILNGIYVQQSNQNSSVYKVTNGEEIVYIPSLGYVTSKYVDFYNDYNGGSGVCCPNLFSYGTGLSVSPSTTYTYSIIYKTTTGYTHPNYMYRYEYNSSGGYLTEGGVHSEGNRTSLGGGWWFAWGQFTTQATAATLNTYLFHYEYATQNRVYVYRAALHQGTYIIPAKFMLTPQENRGTTVATGGGWADLSGRGNNGELVNGVRESSDNLGALVFDGVDDYIDCGNSSNLSITVGTVCAWFKKPHGSGYKGLVDKGRDNYGAWSLNVDETANTATFKARISGNNIVLIASSSYGNDIWNYVCGVYDGTNLSIYQNGTLSNSASYSGTIGTNSVSVRVGSANDGLYFNGNIVQVQIYNKALTAAEIQQNFNALRGRFGI